MGDIVLHTDRGRHTTAVPNIFIDHYIQDANGEFVKIYLYLLRLLQQSGGRFSISALADKFHYTENDVHRALAYWENLDLLKLEYDCDSNLTGICFVEPEASSVSALSVSAPSASPAPAVISAPAAIPAPAAPAAPVSRSETPVYSADKILSFKSQNEVGDLLYAVETYLKRPLTSTDLNTIFYWYDELHFPFDLIEYLIEYCIDKGHPNIRYMNKVALNWADENIRSADEARQSANIHSQTYYAVMKAFGISGRSLIDKEIAFIEKWTGLYGFTLDIITEACARTISNTGRANFSYADSILTSWHEKGIRHPEEIRTLDQAHAASAQKANASLSVRPANNRFHNFHQRPQDDDYYEALEQQLLRK